MKALETLRHMPLVDAKSGSIYRPGRVDSIMGILFLCVGAVLGGVVTVAVVRNGHWLAVFGLAVLAVMNLWYCWKLALGARKGIYPILFRRQYMFSTRGRRPGIFDDESRADRGRVQRRYVTWDFLALMLGLGQSALFSLILGH